MAERLRRNDERLLGCKPQHLAALVAVANAGSFRVAGERLGYVQSAVSRQIAALEEEAGMRLVERTRGATEVRLTQAGELLLRHAEGLLARLDAARTDLSRLADGELGTLRVGVPQGIGQRLLWTALATYRQRRLSARVQASEFSTDEPLFELVQRGTLDLAVAGLPLAPGPFEDDYLMSMRWMLAMPAHWPMAQQEDDIGLLDLDGKPLIGGHSERWGPPLEAQVRAVGGKPNVVFRTDIHDTIVSLVAAGVGAALLPAYTVAQKRDGAIAVRGLKDLPLTGMLGLFWHRERPLTPPAEQFRATLREVCSRIQDGHQSLQALPG